MRPISIGTQLVKKPPASWGSEKGLEKFIINHYDSNSSILTIPQLEIDEEITYKNIKIQLHSNSWNLLQVEEDNCNFTVQKAIQIKSCMTIAETENIVGCPGILKSKQYDHKKLVLGIEIIDDNKYYIWRDLSIKFKSFGEETDYRAVKIISEKYDLNLPQVGVEVCN